MRKINSNCLLKVGQYQELSQANIAFIPCEYIPGITLEKIIPQKGKLTIKECIVVLRKLAQSLVVLETNGVVHRNITPHSLYVTIDGGIRLGNFTMAKCFSTTGTLASSIFNDYFSFDNQSPETQKITTNFSSVLGTIAYMPPEQTFGACNVDARSDIWSWGVIAYELIEGKRPFHGESPLKMVQSIRNAEQPKFTRNISSELKAIIYRALDKNLAKRCQSASEIIKLLDLLKT